MPTRYMSLRCGRENWRPQHREWCSRLLVTNRKDIRRAMLPKGCASSRTIDSGRTHLCGNTLRWVRSSSNADSTFSPQHFVYNALPSRRRMRRVDSAMIDKCANPECEVRFLYLREGKLFVIDDRGDANAWRVGPKATSVGCGRLSYYWLCAMCSKTMSVAVDHQNALQLVPVDYSVPQEH